MKLVSNINGTDYFQLTEAETVEMALQSHFGAAKFITKESIKLVPATTGQRKIYYAHATSKVRKALKIASIEIF